MQNAVARLITSSRKFDCITPILLNLHWLTVSERIKFKIILLTHKALHQQSPIYIQDLIMLLFNFNNATGIFNITADSCQL